MYLVLVVILILVLLGLLPPVSGHQWGYWPSGGLGLLLLVVLLVVLFRGGV